MKASLARINDAIIETVEMTGTMGAPGGILYAALMAFGCSYEEYCLIMDQLVIDKRLVQRGEFYFSPGARP